METSLFRDEKRAWMRTPEKLSETLAYTGEKVFKFSMNNCREWIRILIPEKLADTLKHAGEKMDILKKTKSYRRNPRAIFIHKNFPEKCIFAQI
ncbi:MAG: hypothetical protein Satyrvirus14_17 [Satyrvirus sp.]|uniref:Uncharacterized protein n=1 Tax=Satyrvirus sp. TaxID=2487771 RepID=A0A3G5AGH7_9VIRU|nr:MAG: hypothetical protein Satyrvirus14_17 [Satyrvirus sp.]